MTISSHSLLDQNLLKVVKPYLQVFMLLGELLRLFRVFVKIYCCIGSSQFPVLHVNAE